MSDEVSASANASEATLAWLQKQGTDFDLAEGVEALQPERRPVIGDYVILEKIGSGGMGQVFRARHRTMQRDVAIKLLPKGLSKHPEWVDRFYGEVRAVGRLMHPKHRDRIRCRLYLTRSLSGDGAYRRKLAFAQDRQPWPL